MEDLSISIQGLFSETEASALGSVISFIGARGGVGSSTIAINTGYALGRLFNENITLVDLDLSFGTAALSANLQQKQSVVDALAQPNRLDDVLMARYLLKYDDNLSIIPAPSILGANYGIQMDAFHVFLKILRQMSSYVLLDLPHQWLPWISEVLTDSNEVVLTAYPDLANMRDVKNFIETLSPMRGVGSPPKLIFNRIGAAPRSELSAKDFEDPLKMKFDASIPNDPAGFGTAMNNGVMLYQANSNSKACAEIDKLATLISGRTRTDKKKKSILSTLLKGK
ncbi:MAG: AAA family ATPase, partial [Rhodospirillales bacterium]|nr:AAA family ATPase [Rhodospirillales bacterium]